MDCDKQLHLTKLNNLGYFFYPRLNTVKFKKLTELDLEERCQLLVRSGHPDAGYAVMGNENQRVDTIYLLDCALIPTHKLPNANELTKEELILDKKIPLIKVLTDAFPFGISKGTFSQIRAKSVRY